MAWHTGVLSGLQESDIELVAYLPDSVVWPLIEEVEAADSLDSYVVAREEEAVGLLSGAWLAGRPGVLVCQTSGLANTFNALGSLNKPWRIPFVGIVSRRGNLNEHNLAQAPAGYGMPALLDDIGIRNHVLDRSADVEEDVRMAAQTAFANHEPYVLLLEASLTGGKS